MKACQIEGCLRKRKYATLCGMHYQRIHAGKPIGTAEAKKTPNGTGHTRPGGHIEFNDGLAHVIIVEKVLGYKLPPEVVVHHFDGNGSNNTHANLVVCPSQGYHMLLHQRQRALTECGHAGWLKCNHCKQYDDPENMHVKKDRHQGFHRACEAKYKREKRHADQM